MVSIKGKCQHHYLTVNADNPAVSLLPPLEPQQTQALQRFTLLCCFNSDCVLQKEDRVQLDRSLKIHPAFFSLSLCLNLEVYFHSALL